MKAKRKKDKKRKDKEWMDRLGGELGGVIHGYMGWVMDPGLTRQHK